MTSAIKTHPAMTPEDMTALYARCFPDRPWDESEITTLLNRADVVSVITDNGFVLASCIAPEAEILTIAVSPDHRRQGIASELFRTLWSNFSTRGIDTVFLEVASGNSAAMELYKSFDFQEVGRRKGYYTRINAPAEDAVVMRCALT